MLKEETRVRKKIVAILICLVFLSITIFTEGEEEQNNKINIKQSQEINENDIDLIIMGSIQTIRTSEIGQDNGISMKVINNGPDTAFINIKYKFKKLFTNKIIHEKEINKKELEVSQNYFMGFLNWPFGIGFCHLKLEVFGWGSDEGLYAKKNAYGVCFGDFYGYAFFFINI